MKSIEIRLDDAEKIEQLLEGFSHILRATLPDRLFELLQSLDQTGVYEPLRYDVVPGCGYVADESDAVLRRLRDAMSGEQ